MPSQQHPPPEHDALRLIETPSRYGDPPATAEDIDNILELADFQLVDHEQGCLDAGSRALATLADAVDGVERALQRLQTTVSRLDASASALSSPCIPERAILAVRQLRDIARSVRARATVNAALPAGRAGE
jgi:hypothetical protein